MHICIDDLTIIGSDNGLLPGQYQTIIWTKAGILLIGPLGINFSEISIENSYIFIQENAFQKAVCKMAVILSQPQCVKLTLELSVMSKCEFHVYEQDQHWKS